MFFNTPVDKLECSPPVKYYIIKSQRNSLLTIICLLLEVLALTCRGRAPDAQQEILSLANQSVDQGSVMGPSGDSVKMQNLWPHLRATGSQSIF